MGRNISNTDAMLEKLQKAFHNALQFASSQGLDHYHIIPMFECKRDKWWKKKRQVQAGYYVIDPSLCTVMKRFEI